MDLKRDSLKALLLEALQEHHEEVIDSHASHHEWIQERIEAEKLKKEMLKKVTEAAIQWSVAGLLGAAVYWMQAHFKP
jgi:hypothetical protein